MKLPSKEILVKEMLYHLTKKKSKGLIVAKSLDEILYVYDYVERCAEKNEYDVKTSKKTMKMYINESDLTFAFINGENEKDYKRYDYIGLINVSRYKKKKLQKIIENAKCEIMYTNDRVVIHQSGRKGMHYEK